MDFLKLRILKNFSFLNFLIILFFFFYSFYVTKFQYDGHHIGLIYSNAIDLIKGKAPYKEIFIQYGFLTTLIHSLILLIFKSKVFFIVFFNLIFYSLAIYFISQTVRNLINTKFALISSVIILFNHPIPWLPWSNYLAFFFISISIFLLSKKNKYFLFIGFFMGLSILTRQDFFIPIFISFLIFGIFYICCKNKINYKCFLQLLIGFMSPLLIFLLYLLYLDIYEFWIDYLIIPILYLELYETTITKILFNFIIFFTSTSFFNFVISPQYFVISIILISNLILIILMIFKRVKIQNDVLFIILLSSLLSIVSLKIELFRLYTSVIFGIIPLLYFINKIKDQYLFRNLKLLVLLPSLFSIFFYPIGNNPVFAKINFNSTNSKMLNTQFDYNKWPDTKVNSINIVSNLTSKCKVKYLENLTFDSIFSTIGNFDKIRMLPYEKASLKNSKFHLYVDSIKNPKNNFIKLINDEIHKQNIIILFNENNNIYNYGEIKFTKNYNNIQINESDFVGKPKILNVYFPSKCSK